MHVISGLPCLMSSYGLIFGGYTFLCLELASEESGSAHGNSWLFSVTMMRVVVLVFVLGVESWAIRTGGICRVMDQYVEREKF